MAEGIERELRDWVIDAKNIVVAGIGNPIRTDDFVGLKIAEGLQGKVPKSVCLLECETVPESYLLEIEQFHPTHVLLIDAAVLGYIAGTSSLVDAEEIMAFPALSSHILPLRVFCEYVKKVTGAKIALLLVEPKSVEFGEGLSSEVAVSAKNLTQILLKLLG